MAGNLQPVAQALGVNVLNRGRVHLEVRTIRVTFNAAYAQTRQLPSDERALAVTALVERTRVLLKDVRDRAAADGGTGEMLALIDRAAAEVDRAARA
jgi:hypothetical protein